MEPGVRTIRPRVAMKITAAAALLAPGYYCTDAIIANTGAAIWSDCIEVHS